MLIYAGTKSDFMIDTENDRLDIPATWAHWMMQTA